MSNPILIAENIFGERTKHLFSSFTSMSMERPSEGANVHY